MAVPRIAAGVAVVAGQPVPAWVLAELAELGLPLPMVVVVVVEAQAA
jgi:hypothetical protein